MPMPDPTAELNTQFSEPGATASPWRAVDEVLAGSEMFWLSTIRGDGRPHVTPLPAVWLDRTLHFCSGDAEQKSKNLETSPHCVLTTGTNTLRSGLDVVVEGDAVRVTHADRLAQLARLWKSKLDWDFELAGDAFRDPAGRRGLVFGVRPTKVLAFAKAPYSQTRFRLAGG